MTVTVTVTVTFGGLSCFSLGIDCSFSFRVGLFGTRAIGASYQTPAAIAKSSAEQTGRSTKPAKGRVFDEILQYLHTLIVTVAVSVKVINLWPVLENFTVAVTMTVTVTAA